MELELPEGTYVVAMEEFQKFSPCQDGGIAAFLFEHGDANWPKSLLYVAGWGLGSATLNREPVYDDYPIHFMVTRACGIAKRSEALPIGRKSSEAGTVNPATEQLDF